MGSGFKDWAAGDVLTAADVDGYLMRQTVMTFADASARDTALSGVLDEGMVTYLEDTNALTVYNGSAWVAVIDSDVLTVDTSNNRVGINDSTPSYALDVTGDINASADLRIGGNQVGEWINYAGTQTFGGLTLGNGTLVSYYSRVKDIVFMRGYFQLGSTSTMTGPLDMSVPAASQAAIIQEWTGHVRFWDQSANIFYAGTPLSLGSSSYRMSYMGVNAGLLGNYDLSPTAPFTWTTGDAFLWSFYYQAA